MLMKKVKSTRQQRADLALDFLLAGLAEADVCADDLALTVYQEGTRHALEGQRLGGVSFRVKGHGEAGGVAGEEAARLGGVLVNAHGHDDQALVAVARLHLVHPRERLAARRAPGRPVVEIDDLATQAREPQRALVGGDGDVGKTGGAGRREQGKGNDENQGTDKTKTIHEYRKFRCRDSMLKE